MRLSLWADGVEDYEREGVREDSPPEIATRHTETVHMEDALCGRNSYVEIKGSWPCLHKTLSGAERWNRANFAITEFHEVRLA
jgi:hypothetical protein